jgi:hypothetical protein
LIDAELSSSPSFHSIACLDEIETLPLYANHSPKAGERSMKRSENNDSMIDAIRRRFFLLNFHFSSVDDSRHSVRSREQEKRKIQKNTNSLAKLEPDWEFKIFR